MRIYTLDNNLAFKIFTFPDGQPHFKLETHDREFNAVTVETTIRNPADLFTTLLASGVLREQGYSEVNLDIRYLMGARMDRAISSLEPFTLQVMARLINGAGFSKVRILDVHSDVATRLIRNSENVLPKAVVAQVWSTIGPHLDVCPDKGAIPRIRALLSGEMPAIICEKDRDLCSGKLRGFRVIDGLDYLATPFWQERPFLIIDDICDGGGTFVGIAKELRQAGAKKVDLFVTHAIMSQGMTKGSYTQPLDGIDHIYTTDSYWSGNSPQSHNFTVIPISMKDLK